MLAAAFLALLQASGPARVSSVAPPTGLFLRSARLLDQDGAGPLDLCLVASPARGGERRLCIHLGRQAPARFSQAPDLELALTPDVVAVAPADVHPDPGRELVLLTARGAFVWRPRAPSDAERFARLATVDLLWQLAGRNDVLWWDEGVRDFDGDGLEDLLVPEPQGYRVFLQERSAEGARLVPEAFCPVPPPTPLRRPGVRTAHLLGARKDAPGERGLSLRLGSSSGIAARFGGAPLFQLSTRLPAPGIADWDGDGRLDLCAGTQSELLVFPRVGSAQRLLLPFAVDRSRRMDVSYAALFGELDGDGRADCVLFAGDRNAKDVRTQVLVFTHAAAPKGEPALFGAEGRPRELLVLAGFAGAPRLVDVDQDQRLDLVVGALRPDLLESLSGRGEALELELDVFRNLGQRFSRQPALAARLRIAADALERGDGVRFVGDASGDGVRDLCVRGETRLELYAVRPGRQESFTWLERPLVTLPLAEDDLVEVDASGEVLLLQESGLRHVEFKP
jgi:hypothetical protein